MDTKFDMLCCVTGRLCHSLYISLSHCMPSCYAVAPISLRANIGLSLHWPQVECLTCLFMLLPRLLTLSTYHSLSITPSRFHSRLKTYLFTSLSLHRLPSSLRTDSTALWLVCFFWASRFLILVFSLVFFCLGPCGRLSSLYVSFWVHVNLRSFKLEVKSNLNVVTV